MPTPDRTAAATGSPAWTGATDPANLEEPYSHGELRGEAFDMLAGTIDPLVSTSTACMNFVARHTEVQDRMGEEVDEVLGGRPPTAADFDRLPYAQAVFKETLRSGAAGSHPGSGHTGRHRTGRPLHPEGDLRGPGSAPGSAPGEALRTSAGVSAGTLAGWIDCGSSLPRLPAVRARAARLRRNATGVLLGPFLVAGLAQRVRLASVSKRPTKIKSIPIYEIQGRVPVVVTHRRR